MGVSSRTYIVVGIMFNYNDLKSKFNDDDFDFYDRFEDYQISNYRGPTENQKDLGIIQDGMSGKYIFCGKTLNYSDEYGGLPTICIEDFKISNEEKSNIVMNVENLLGYKISEIQENVECKTYIFTHYS